MAEKDKKDDPTGSITKSFDQYEYVAVIIPGAVLLFGALLMYVTQLPSLSDVKDVSVGALGLFLLAAYVTGHFVRAIGEFLEAAFWNCFGGAPTDWIPDPDNAKRLLDDDHRTLLAARLSKLLNKDVKLDDYKSKNDEWRAVVRRIYAAVARAQSNARIDAFNRTYGLMIGITVALVIVAVLALVQGVVIGPLWPKASLIAVVALVLAALTLHRAYVFGKHYGRELLVQFLELPPAV